MTPARFRRRLLAWYDRHGRKDLPWQQRRSAYRVWVSEIMLQQTQVATVIPYYQRFLKSFPTLKSLASAPLDSVLQHWTGLGYYARARNLHKAAQTIQAEHGGRFPRDIEQVSALPGIGRSTAGAILAFSFDQHHPILDGNVKRVLCRVHGIEDWPGEKRVERGLWELAQRYTPKTRVADFTQAIMDLGATVCTLRRPQCETCPFSGDCVARATGKAETCPGKKPGRIIPQRHTCMLILRDSEGRVLLQRRPPAGIWGGLWSLPELEPGNAASLAREAQRRLGLKIAALKTLPAFRHVFSHFRLEITPVTAKVVGSHARLMEHTDTIWYNVGQAEPGGFAAPVKRLLQALRNPE
jgi:A/G-specific adenine glycosylase